jgi:hypothetical protein
MLELFGCGSHKKHTRTRYAELVFLLLVGSARHVVGSSASVAQNVDAIFFMLGLAQCGCPKKRVTTRYAELVFLHLVRSMGHVVCSSGPGHETWMHNFSCSGWPDADATNACLDTLRRTCVFASS